MSIEKENQDFNNPIKYKLEKSDGNARAGVITTPHGEIKKFHLYLFFLNIEIKV